MTKKSEKTSNALPQQALKSGLITLVGRSNVGKSTLLNTLIGTKLAAVTHKPQTTRSAIHGVLNRPEGQAVFIDTPGVLKGNRRPLTGKLLENVTEALRDIDLVLYVVDPGKPVGPEERFTLSLLRQLTIPKLLVINKCDVPEIQQSYRDDYRALANEFTDVFELSALRNRHIQPLIAKVFELLPPGEPLYPPEQITNMNKEMWVAEIIREKIFLALRQEVPYSTHVEVTNIEAKPDVFVITATIFTSERRYKQMIIGAGGRAIKEIGSAARRELEQALNKKIFLELDVAIDHHWIERI